MTAERSTIAGLLTPLSPGAIAVVGLSGPATKPILNQILRKHAGDAVVPLVPRHLYYCRIMDGERVLDDAVVVCLDRDGSTRAELNTHGGVRIAQRVLLLLERHGARIVDGASFHEAVGGRGAVERAVDQALLRSPSRRLTHWLLTQRTILPAYLAKFNSLSDREQAAYRRRSEVAIRLLEGLHVAIVGPPNAGKSTLANRLIGVDRAITSEQAGTTRDWISETAIIDGWPVTLTDTAGLRETDCTLEAEAIRRGRVRAGQADAVVILVDACLPVATQREQAAGILESLQEDAPKLLALNKCDRADAADEFVPGKAGAGDGPVRLEVDGVDRCAGSCRVSAMTGSGLDELERRLVSLLGLDLLSDTAPTSFDAAHLL